MSYLKTRGEIILLVLDGNKFSIFDETDAVLTIDDSGNVGIGTSTFTSASAGRTVLEVNGASASALINLSVNGTRQGYIFTDTTDMNVYNVDNGSLNFGTNNTERMRIDASGNVGIGCTPEDWDPVFDVLRIGKTGFLFSYDTAGDGMWLGSNAFYDDTLNDYKYISTDPASLYTQLNGTHSWSYAASGTANTQATFSEAMRIDASGNLLVGTTGVPNAGTSVYGTGLIPGLDGRTQLHMATDSSSNLFHVRFYNPNGAVDLIEGLPFKNRGNVFCNDLQHLGRSTPQGKHCRR